MATYTNAFLQDLHIRQHATPSKTYLSDTGDTYIGLLNGSLGFVSSNFDKRAQDAVGKIIKNTNNIDGVYNPYTSISFDLTDEGSAGTFGDATHIPVVTVDSKGRVTGITLVAISAGVSFQLITITGTVDGTNAIFTCSSTPLQVFNSGRLMYLTNDYTLSGVGNTIVTFNSDKIPFVGDILKAFGNL